MNSCLPFALPSTASITSAALSGARSAAPSRCIEPECQRSSKVTSEVLMSVVNISSSRTLPDMEIEQVAQLAVSVSGRLNRAHHREVAPAIADAVEQIAAVTHAGSCALIEFTASGPVVRTHGGM